MNRCIFNPIQLDMLENCTKYFQRFSPCSSPALVQKHSLLCTHGPGGLVSKCVEDLDDTVMTQSKTEPSVPMSQEAMRLMTCDNL